MVPLPIILDIFILHVHTLQFSPFFHETLTYSTQAIDKYLYLSLLFTLSYSCGPALTVWE